MLTRRQLLKLSAGSLGSLAAYKAWPFQLNQNSEDPHFFLCLFIDGGLDWSYLFDARPLEMTEKGLIQNYLGKQPERWEGKNGLSTWATALAEPLKPFKDDFSVLNGVMMSTAFDGHPQNVNFLFTGSPFTGEDFMPHLNQMGQGASSTPLNVVMNGRMPAEISNGSLSVSLTPEALRQLIPKLDGIEVIQPQNPMYKFLSETYQRNSAGLGRFSLGAKLMHTSLQRTPGLASDLKNLKLDNYSDSIVDFVKMAAQMFVNKIARSAYISPDYFQRQPILFVDCHDANSAKQVPQLMQDVVKTWADILSTLKSTAYDQTRSMLDVTTVMLTSEFSRTMRQSGKDIGNTGTDHNPLNNTVLLGGKGIRGGLVVGASDYQTAESELSPVHLAMDSGKLKCMGKVFDVEQLQPKEDLPQTYKAEHYLNISSVINTIYSAFNVKPEMYRLLERNGAMAPVLRKLLK